MVLHPGEVLAMESVAILAVAASPRLRVAGQWLVLALLCAASFSLLAVTFATTEWKDAFKGFPAIFLCGVCFWIVAQRVHKWGRPYRIVCSCLTSVACLFVGAIIAWSLLDTAVRYLPYVYDPVLFRFDYILNLNIFYHLAVLLGNHPQLYQLILVLYKYNLVFAIPAIFSEAFHTRKAASTLPLELLLSSFLVFPFFCMVPALAPAFFFGGAFPSALPSAMALPLHAVVAPASSIRNTFPSLHASWAILCVLALRDSPLWHRLVGISYMFFIFVATLGFGEHYAIDWLGAMPLVLVVRSLAALPRPAKVWFPPLICGLLLLFGWVLEIQHADFVRELPVCLWGLAGMSLILPIWFEAKLAVAERKTC
ncbi:phosphatase PAP2 family protein [Acidocella sp.]|uniref:phosphatase PAP2 family protein n=1 Tax=Acidocella sp. TaxID=50710 RepID=UPI003D05D192